MRRGILLLLAAAAAGMSGARAQEAPAMQVMEAPGGVRFGLFGARSATPAPTLFVSAVAVDDMAKQPVYTETGRRLAAQGWLYVALDPPCHGRDQRPDEPPQLDGWAHRVKAGQPLMEPFTRRCRAVLDFLVAGGYTDPRRVAAGGTSRGGFCALHFAAAEPRVRAVACISPVTNLRVLREFAGIGEEQVRDLNVSALAEPLAGRAVWLSIGNHDERVGTDDCIAAARRLAAAGRARNPDNPVVPVELLVGPSRGHGAIEGAYELAARFLAHAVKGGR